MAAAIAVGLTGCASVPTLSEEQNDAIAEYMADSLLKSDKNYSNTIKLNSNIEAVTPEPSVKPTVSPEKSAAPTEPAQKSSDDGNSVNDTPKESGKPAETDGAKGDTEPAQTYVSLSDAMNISGFKVKIKGYKCSTNISTSDSNISSERGKKLFVINMKLKNDAGVTKKLDMTKNHSNYSLSIDGKQMESPLLTIADEDIHFIKKKVSAKKSLNAILVFEIPSDTKLKNVVLEVTNKDAVAQLNIK